MEEDDMHLGPCSEACHITLKISATAVNWTGISNGISWHYGISTQLVPSESTELGESHTEAQTGFQQGVPDLTSVGADVQGRDSAAMQRLPWQQSCSLHVPIPLQLHQ